MPYPSGYMSNWKPTFLWGKRENFLSQDSNEDKWYLSSDWAGTFQSSEQSVWDLLLPSVKRDSFFLIQSFATECTEFWGLWDRKTYHDYSISEGSQASKCYPD